MSGTGTPYFDSSELPTPENKYVCWMDIMGIQSVMSRSLDTSANYVYKFHSTVLDAEDDEDIELYPVMDGVYITSVSRDSLTHLLHNIFTTISNSIIEADKEYYKFILRASISYGPIVSGSDVPEEANEVLYNSDYADSLLLGIPMIQAFRTESAAPPFGVYIDESARAFAPEDDEPFNYSWWEWFESSDEEYDCRYLAIRLHNSLMSYYDYCEENSHSIEYEKSAIKEHRMRANQYLPHPYRN